MMSSIARKNNIDSNKLSMELRKLEANLEEKISVIEHKMSGINMAIVTHATPIYLQKSGNRDYLGSYDTVHILDCEEPRSRASSFGTAESVQSLRRKIKCLSVDKEQLKENNTQHLQCHNQQGVTPRNLHHCDTCSALSRVNPRGRRNSLPATLIHVKPIIKLKNSSNNSLNTSRSSLNGSRNKLSESPFDADEIDMNLRRVKRELGKRKPKSLSELKADMTTTYQHRKELAQVEQEIIDDMMRSMDEKYYKELESCRYLRKKGSEMKELSVDEIFSHPSVS